MKILELSGLSMSFGGKPVLSGVYFYLSEGEVVGILGRNGSGKTTLFRGIFGLLSTNTGVVRIGGSFCPKRDRWREIGYLPQVSFLPPDRTVRSAVNLFANRAERDRIFADPRIKDVLRTNCGSLSGGERRYLEFLLIVSLKRSFLLLDELFSEIEPKYVELLFEKIREIAAGGTAIAVTDHNHWSVREISSRLLLLTAGSLRDVENTEGDLRRYGYLPSRAQN